MNLTTGWSQWLGTNEQWDVQQLKLSDPCIYQSSSWAAHRATFGWKAIRLMNRSETCFAQILHRNIYGLTIAWIPGGPTGNLGDINKDLVTEFCRIIKTSRVYLRLNSLEQNSQDTEKHLFDNKFHRVKNKLSSGLSLIYALDKDQIKQRENLSSNWGRNLRRGETRNNEPYLWQQIDPAEVTTLYQQLVDYKDLTTSSEVLNSATINSLIKNCESHLQVFRCDDDLGKPLAIRGALIFGNKAWDIFAAVSPQGRKQYSSYVTAWALLNHCALMGLQIYDLSGVDPVKNKGVYDFKHGTGATEFQYIGEWDCGTPLIVKSIVGRLMKYRKNL